jgi:predicted short-subunit dehydrogenase-like oxidoreductase (DUF2520 family)
MNIKLIGYGNVATSFAAHLEKNKISFLHFDPKKEKRYFEENDEENDAFIYLLAINEQNLASVCQKFQGKNKKSIYVHFSASINREIFPENIRKNSVVLHPMQSFPNRNDIILLEDLAFTFQGEDSVYKELLKLFKKLNLTVIPLQLKSPEAYHLMGVISSNLMIALFSIAEQLGKMNGLNSDDTRELLLPLMKQSLKNLEKNSTFDALSGPLKRGAFDIIQKHEQFLESFSESYQDIYRLLNQELMENVISKKGER